MATTTSKTISDKKTNSPDRRIVLIDKQEYVFLKIENIAYAEANGAYTNVYLVNGNKMLVCKNLKTLSDKLPDNEFIRVHKSFIINVNFISKYIRSDGGYLIMENGKSIPVSVRKKDVVIKLIEKILL